MSGDSQTKLRSRIRITQRADYLPDERPLAGILIALLKMGEQAFRGTALEIMRRADRFDIGANEIGSYGNR